MNPLLQILKLALREKVVILMLGMAAGVETDTSLPFLAKVLHPNGRETEGKKIIISARKERVALQILSDSINELDTIYSKHQHITKILDEKVNSNIDTATDVQLDSILARYKYIPFTKERNSERVDSLR